MPPKGYQKAGQGQIKSKDAGNAGNVNKTRHINVYDAVAGRVGPRGYLTEQQISLSKPTPSAPEEILFRRRHGMSKTARNENFFNIYNADERLLPEQVLPDSDLLKALHAYVSDFYSMAITDRNNRDYRSMDETALLAMGILLEEAAREVLGENGDMALVEPEGLENGLPESKATMYQVIGRVKPELTPEPEKSTTETESEEDQRPRKKRRARKYDQQV